MARVRKRITIKKALQSFAMYSVAVGGALATVEIPEGDLTDKALISLGIGTLAAVLRAVNNVRKRRAAPTVSGYGGVHYGLLLAVGLALAGCATTQSTDGTITTTIDQDALSTAWETWAQYDRQRIELERAKAEADAAERAAIEAELRRLAPEIGEAWADVMDKY